MKKFITIFEELLEENNLTIKSFAKIVGVYFSVFYAYKNKNYLPTVKIATVIANYFGCSLNFLMGLESDIDKIKYKKDFDISKFYPRYINLLESKNLKHFSLCKKIDLNVSSLLNWKSGKTPKMEPLIKIAKYFDCSIDYLVGRSDNF